MDIYTKDEIIKSLRDRYRSYNYGVTPLTELVNGLTMQQHEHIGNVILALKDLDCKMKAA